jgi:hypothetical protein
MKTIYLTNGKLDDDAFTGITVTHYYLKDDSTIVGQNATLDGKPFLGYLPNEITKEEYDIWKERIATPDNVTYFAGVFAGVGVIDKATRQSLDAKIAEAKQAHNEKQVEANCINFKLAKLDADAIGEDHEAVFTSQHPQVSEDVKAMLFAEVRAAQAKAAKKKGK